MKKNLYNKYLPPLKYNLKCILKNNSDHLGLSQANNYKKKLPQLLSRYLENYL